MKTYSQQERFQIYTEALSILRKKYAEDMLCGICLCLSDAVERLYPSPDCYLEPFIYMEELFPEISAQKPPSIHRKNDSYWFPLNGSGYRQRKELLKNAIQQTNETIHTITT